MHGRRAVRRNAEPGSFIMPCKQSCLLYKHPWKNNSEQGAFSTSFTTKQKSEKLTGNCLPATAKIQWLPKPTEQSQVSLSTSVSLTPHTPCLTTWAGNNSQPLKQSMWIHLCSSKAQRHSGCCRVSVCLWVHGAHNPCSYWTNIYHLQLCSFPKWNFPLRNEVIAGSSETSLQDFLSNFCAGSGTHFMSILTPGSSLPLSCAVSPAALEQVLCLVVLTISVP